jgi:DNA segregation ATPase FtsK/SpoIIIE, S-DNA-T family
MSANAVKNVNSSKKSSKNEDFEIEKQLASNKKNKSNSNKDDKGIRMVGILFILLAFFFIWSFCSYCFTWQHDQDGLLNNGGFKHYFVDFKGAVANAAGKLGAYTSHKLIFNGFGLLAFLIIPFVAGIGYNCFNPKPRFKLLSYLKLCLPVIIVGSPLFAYLTCSSAFAFGGAFGNICVQYLQEFAGNIGTGFILFGIVAMGIIFYFNPQFNTTLPNWLAFKKPQLPPNINDKVQASAINNTLAQQQQQLEHSINTDYESREAELYIHKELEAPPQPQAITENINQLLQDNDEQEDKLELEEELIEDVHNTAEIELSTITTTEVEAATNLRTDVDFEVVQKEEEQIAINNTHSSVENLEPYDPSLDLRNYKFPTIDLLEDRGNETVSVSKEELEANKNQIIQTLKNFSISISKISATVGPTVTLYEIVPAEGVRISKIRNLEDDIALSLSALGIRIIAPIPGKGTIGIEVPNKTKLTVSMRTLITSEKFVNSNAQLPIAIGKKIDNENYIGDLATMPHLLMAGATGQGKSVGLNAILVSLLYKKHPSQLKFVLVDPKKVELSIYKLIEKHFLAKLPNEEEAIITDTKKVINTLNSLCIEMDNRYDLLKEASVRNIKEYNEKFIKRKLNPQKGHRYMPFIVLVVDEFADLIMTAGKEVEMPIARLAQLARAIGIHLIIATQRPSVNVITGTIKANFPARIAFRVSAKVDSRTILDAGGAEQLIGRGDMLVSNGNELTRLQCAFVDTPEVERIVEFIGQQQGYATAYDLPEYLGADADMDDMGGVKNIGDLDQMFAQCARLVVSSGSGSTSMLQRRFNLGYNRAGRIMDQLEAAGIVGPTSGGKPRELMVKTEAELEQILQSLM